MPALDATIIVAWLYLVHLSLAMPGMNMADMPGMAMSAGKRCVALGNLRLLAVQGVDPSQLATR